MKNVSLNLPQIKLSFLKASRAVLRYHLVLTVIITCGFLIFVVLTVNNILSHTQDEDYDTEQHALNSVRTRFDEKTINKINELKSRQENPSLSLPEGRRNPFNE